MAKVTVKVDEIVKKFSTGLNSEFQKIGKELKAKGAEINSKLASDKKVQEALNRYHQLLKSASDSQAHLNTEIEAAVERLQKGAVQVEKNLIAYKKKALAQKAKLEKLLQKTIVKKGSKTAKTSAASKSSKKTTSARTKKKATAKTTKKTSSKKA